MLDTLTNDAVRVALGPDLGIKVATVKDLAVELVTQVDGMSELLKAGRPDEIDLSKGIVIREELLRYEIRMITLALRITSNHQQRAARILGVNATTLNSKIKRYRLGPFNEEVPQSVSTREPTLKASGRQESPLSNSFSGRSRQDQEAWS